MHRRQHAGAGRQTVIDQNHCLAGDLGGATAAPVGSLTTDQFAAFTLGDITELLRGDPQRAQHVVVDNHPSPTGQGPDGELFVPGRAELAHHERVERRTDRGGDLPGHRDAAARQTEDQHVRVPAVGVEQPGQDTAGLSTVPEHASW